MQKIKVVKKCDITTGREQRYAPVVKEESVESKVKLTVQAWILATRNRKQQEELAAYNFSKVC